MSGLRRKIAEKKAAEEAAKVLELPESSLATLRIGGDPSPVTSHTHEGFAVQQTVGRGLGCFALADIAPGTRIISEKPLLERSLNEIEEADEPVEAMEAFVAAALKPSERVEYDALCMHAAQNLEDGADKTAYGIWSTNAYTLKSEVVSGQAPPEERAAIFTIISRFNHSCQPTAHVAWNGRIGRMTVHALTPIRAGEEITVSYCLVGDGNVRDARQSHLSKTFGWTCRCRLCALEGPARVESDARQTRIKELAALLAHNPPITLELVAERLALLAEEGLHTNWGTHAVAMSFLQRCGDEGGAQDWAAQAADSVKLAMGEDCDEYLRYELLSELGELMGEF